MVTGYTLNKRLLVGHWFISMVGFNLCFFPMHFLGLSGLPRRVCCYEPSFYFVNNLRSLGGLLSVGSGFLFVYIL